MTMSEHSHGAQAPAEKVTDPVCGMQMKAEKAAATIEFQGKTYYFCSQACHKQFQQDPPRYAA